MSMHLKVTGSVFGKLATSASGDLSRIGVEQRRCFPGE